MVRSEEALQRRAERSRAYRRERYKADRAKYLADNNVRRKTTEGLARAALHEAMKRGKVIKPDRCEHCSRTFPKAAIHGHHADYSKPLDVVWLCRTCHAREHWSIDNHTAPTGEDHPKAKLTAEMVTEARQAKAAGASVRALARKFGVDESTLRAACNGKAWRHV